jgi:microcystin-dependent protein
MHQGNGFVLAETGGAEEITLTTTQIPAHNHAFLASTNISDQISPSNSLLGQLTGGAFLYFAVAGNSPLAPQSMGSTGGSQPHTNFQPYLCVDFIISLFGIFPSPT